MRSNAYTNGQDLLNWYKTPEDKMDFTRKGYPIVLPVRFTIPRMGIKAKPFNYALSATDYDYFIHFYIQDYMFERIWNNPLRYIEVLKKFKGIIMPDFSIFTDMPVPLQQYNHYRNLWFARMCQINGIKVICSPNWSDENSWLWCFEGIPRHNVICISCVGGLKEVAIREKFKAGLDRAIKVLQPKIILLRCTSQKTYLEMKDYIEKRYRVKVRKVCKDERK